MRADTCGIAGDTQTTLMISGCTRRRLHDTGAGRKGTRQLTHAYGSPTVSQLCHPTPQCSRPPQLRSTGKSLDLRKSDVVVGHRRLGGWRQRPEPRIARKHVFEPSGLAFDSTSPVTVDFLARPAATRFARPSSSRAVYAAVSCPLPPSMRTRYRRKPSRESGRRNSQGCWSAWYSPMK